jgi:hypothetical protein
MEHRRSGSGMQEKSAGRPSVCGEDADQSGRLRRRSSDFAAPPLEARADLLYKG